MKRIARKAFETARTDGLFSLSKSVLTRARNRYPAVVAEQLVRAFTASGRVVEADSVVADVTRYGRAETVTVEIAGGTPHPDLREQEGVWEASPQSVRVLNDVRVVGPYGIVFTDDGRIVLDCSCGSEFMLRTAIQKSIENHGLLRTLSLLTRGFTGVGVRERDSDYRHAMSLLNTHADNYFHWTVEHLPRLRCLEHLDGIDPDEVELVVEADAPSFASDSLELFGHPDYTSFGAEAMRFPSLVVPDHRLRSRSHEFEISPSDLRWLRRRATEAAGDDRPTRTPTRLFVSRADADVRNVANSDDVSAAIAQLGFQTVVLSELSVAAQIRLFRDAEVVVGPHGAGLGNVVYSDSTTVVELYGTDIVQGRYFTVLAGELGHRYYTVECETDGHDIVAPVGQLVELLREATSDDG